MPSYTFSQLIDFTRTTSATYVNSAGLIATTPVSTNLLTFTQEFANAAWTKTAATVTANSTTAPDGTSTADKVVGTSTTNFHNVFQGYTAAAATYTYSVYCKAAEYSKAVLSNGTTGTWSATFDLAAGTAGATYGASVISSSITAAGDGWFRCSVTFTGVASLIAYAVGGYPNSGATLNGYGASYTGDGTSGILIWGAQLETGSTATTYTRNYGGLYPPRFDYDPVTLAPKGLLIEEQRTNLVTYSEQFDNAAWTAANATITANAAVSPSGVTTADAMVEDTANSTHAVYEYFAIAASTTYTATVYVKRGSGTRNFYIQANLNGGTTGAGFAWFDLGTGVATAPATITGTFVGVSASMTAVGNGWYRCSMTFTSNTGNNFISLYHAIYNGARVYTGDGTSGVLVWGAQLEAGAFATSYIPTVASQVTRTADIPAINAPNFAPWYNPIEGTFVASISRATNVAQSGAPWSIEDGTLGNRIGVRIDSSTAGFALTNVAGSLDVAIPLTYSSASTINTAFAYKLNDFAAVVNGGTVGTDTLSNVPSVDRMTIGYLLGPGQLLNGHIRSIRYYPTRLTNAQLQALTA